MKDACELDSIEIEIEWWWDFNESFRVWNGNGEAWIEVTATTDEARFFTTRELAHPIKQPPLLTHFKELIEAKATRSIALNMMDIILHYWEEEE